MAPFNLQGLNVVQPAPSPTTHDGNDPLASPFPDFSAHLDLWTNLAFESDEPLAPNKGKRKLTDEEHENPLLLGLPHQDNHENIAHQRNPLPFDINAIFSGFRIDPLLMPAAQPAPIQGNITNHPPAPSLAQLLALHAAHGGTHTVPPPPPAIATQLQQSHVASSASKRARTQKAPSSTDDSETHSPTTTSTQLPEDSTQLDPAATTLSASEDKRRRNTAASARFRLKKKEREAALERRAKELEDRVAELERECEGLRRENGWLKGLVVGVTGVGAAQQQQTAAK